MRAATSGASSRSRCASRAGGLPAPRPARRRSPRPDPRAAASVRSRQGAIRPVLGRDAAPRAALGHPRSGGHRADHRTRRGQAARRARRHPGAVSGDPGVHHPTGDPRHVRCGREHPLDRVGSRVRHSRERRQRIRRSGRDRLHAPDRRAPPERTRGEVPIIVHPAGADRPRVLCGQGTAPAAAPSHGWASWA